MCLSIQPRDAHGGCLGLGSMHMGGCLGLGCVPMGAALALAAACPQIWIDFQKMWVFFWKRRLFAPWRQALCMLGCPEACSHACHTASPHVVPHFSKIGQMGSLQADARSMQMLRHAVRRMFPATIVATMSPRA